MSSVRGVIARATVLIAATATMLSIAAIPNAVAAQSASSSPSTSPVIVRAFDHTPVSYTSTDNRRAVTAPAAFPATGDFSNITLHLRLDCPTGGCDPWDRFGTIGIVTSPAVGDTPATTIELARFMTPYGVGGRWSIDVTDMRPLLTGNVTLGAFIDTWVGPGTDGGAGWQVSTWFSMTPGRPAHPSVAVIPVWSLREVTYGDPQKPTSVDAPPVNLDLPRATTYALRTFVTGHGQGNEDDCSEFCPRTQTVAVNGTPHRLDGWRTDCATSGVRGQRGNYWYSRANWCPGSLVTPWMTDVTRDVIPAPDHQRAARVTYAVTPYVNGCRPGATPFIPILCVFGTSADYDGGAHTPPIYRLSSVLIAYR